MSSTLTQNPYISRFEEMLKPLQSELSELEQKLDSIKNDHPDKQKTRLDILTEINNTKQAIENIQKNLDRSITMPITRSDKVPSDIPDHNVWNDCWYDEERKAFVTLNQRLEKVPNARTREIQIQYDKEMGANFGIILEEEKIEFRYGYPSILRENQDGNPVWFLLPTMKDEMLTNEIVTGRLRPKSNHESVIYETEAEQWITIGTKGLSLCEKENQISDELELYPKVPLEELKSLYGRK